MHHFEYNTAYFWGVLFMTPELIRLWILRSRTDRSFVPLHPCRLFSILNPHPLVFVNFVGLFGHG